MRDPLYADHRGAPLAFTRTPLPGPPTLPEVCAARLEYTSRGDWVPARLLWPEAGCHPLPVVLLQHDLGGSKQAADLDGIAARCLRGGAAVASIDFPLHGERASPKLSPRFVAGVTRALRGEMGGDVSWLGAIARQAVMDLSRALDALAQQPELDLDRVVYAGVGLGAILGALFCVEDPRPRAAALALCGGGFGASELDPERCIGRIAPRPVLVVNSRSDSSLPTRATEILFAAAAEPKELHWFDGSGTPLPEVALAKIWSFLERNLQTRVA